MRRRPPRSTRTDALVPETTLCRSLGQRIELLEVVPVIPSQLVVAPGGIGHQALDPWWQIDAVIGPRGPQANDVRELVMRHQQLVILHAADRKSTRLNSSH